MFADDEKKFDKFAQQYDFYNNLISFGTHKFVKKMCVDLLAIKKNAKILDLCCGTGDVARILQTKEESAKIVGLDISEKMLEIAEKKSKNIEFIFGSAENLSFADNSFDIITMSFGLRNVQNKEKAISEINRVLKNDGQFLYIDFAKPNSFAQKIFCFNTKIAKKFFTKKVPSEYFVSSIENFFTPAELVAIFEQQGFLLKQAKRFMFGVILVQCYGKNLC